MNLSDLIGKIIGYCLVIIVFLYVINKKKE